ncbi:MAG: hypothetical protein DWQ02_21180 [Bacteroidetes bacterium]|nr:MAG: hypothetical protein DWQ02_21180 [Bacteroidota bacterium]
MPKPKNNLVFSVYPNSSGFGFVYMAGPRKLIDFGSVRISPINNRKVMDRIKKAIEYFQPLILVVQDPKGRTSRTGKRVKRLISNISKYATQNNLTVTQYSRDRIREVFEQFGVVTKYEISQVLITEFKELERKSPKPRKLWTSEDRNMAIFDALSLALTWYYLNE